MSKVVNGRRHIRQTNGLSFRAPFQTCTVTVFNGIKFSSQWKNGWKKTYRERKHTFLDRTQPLLFIYLQLNEILNAKLCVRR